MKKFIYISLPLLLFTVLSFNSYSQGCVAIRTGGMACSVDHPMTDTTGKGWQIGASYRYFKSFRHFRGRTQEKHRVEENTEVINLTHSVDFSVARQFNNRWSASVALPYITNDRSSLYEHGGKERHTTNSKGIGDLRIMANRWILDPKKSKKINFQLGLGIKLPTGAFNYKDEFHTAEGGTEERAVDQSIQLGDGGVGGIVTVDAYYNISHQLSLYGNLFYLSNPGNTNGTVSRGSVYSIADQYMGRIGANYSPSFVKDFSIGAGLRMEGIPSEDLIGKSDGRRRPGYIISLEPGASYQLGKMNIYATVPIALQRNRVQNVDDKKKSAELGYKVVGDAAFADYSINIGATYNF